MIENTSSRITPVSRWVAIGLALAADLIIFILSINGGPLSMLFGFPTVYIIVLLLMPFFFLLLISLNNACHRLPD